MRSLLESQKSISHTFRIVGAVAIDESRSVLHVGGMGSLLGSFDAKVAPAEGYTQSSYICSHTISIFNWLILFVDAV